MNTKVCLLCRVSTQAQDYEYQVNLLTDIAESRNWEVYDEDGEYQGMFCGDINNTSEEEIWEGL